MKKILLILLIVFLFTLLSCEETLNEPVEFEKEIITFRITWKTYSPRGEAIQGIVNDFNLSQEKYFVEMISGDEDLDLINQQLLDDSVDVFVLPYRYVQLLGHEEKLKYINREALIGSGIIAQDLLDLGEIDKICYGIPWVSHSMALIYNKDLLTEAGIDPSSIIDKETFEAALIAVEENTLAKGIGLVGADHNDLSWMVNQFIYGNGGLLVKDNQVMLDSLEVKTAIAYYRDNLSKYAQETWLEDTGNEVMSAFRNEEVAFEIQSLWGLTDIWKNNSPFEVEAMSLGRIGANSEVGPMMLSYDHSLSVEKEVGAGLFIQYMLTKEAQIEIMKGEYSPEKNENYPFRLPVRDDIISSEAFKPYEEFNVFIESYDIASIDVPTPRWMLVKEEVYTFNLHKVMKNEISIDDFISILYKEGNEILKGEQ